MIEALCESFLKLCPKKLRPLAAKLFNREMILYLVFGVLTTLVNYIIYYGLRFLGVNYLIANGLAWVGAVAFAYVTNKLFVFESRSWKASLVVKEALSFAAGRLVTGLLETLLLLIFVEGLKLPDGAVKLVASVLVIVLNYVFSKLFIFRKKGER